ncbi:MAG: hypothetical protein KME13_13125 [Myxacorys californica WJT36-NPBG1]|jgi:hypothetical protein|nr:hypothetical protein [Myxacorys californica WJT36-NPBG1]
MSLLFAPFIWLDLVSGKISEEDIAEGWVFSVAAIGWFHWFWLSITIKNWFFSSGEQKL